jgi:hypothetical protein
VPYPATTSLNHNKHNGKGRNTPKPCIHKPQTQSYQRACSPSGQPPYKPLPNTPCSHPFTSPEPQTHTSVTPRHTHLGLSSNYTLQRDILCPRKAEGGVNGEKCHVVTRRTLPMGLVVARHVVQWHKSLVRCNGVTGTRGVCMQWYEKCGLPSFVMARCGVKRGVLRRKYRMEYK